MPDPSLPPEALRAGSLALDEACRKEFGFAWNAEFTEEAVAAVVAAVTPFMLPKRQPRIVCPVCTREVVKRDDDTPRSHDVPVERRDLMCEDTFGRCRGGCRCRKCRPQRKETPNA